jgi:hypothetical protein
MQRRACPIRVSSVSIRGFSKLRPDHLFRFDVVEVIFTENTKPHLELIKNAFQLPQSYIY